MSKVNYPTTTHCGALVSAAVAKIAEGLGDLQRVKAIMDAVAYPGPDFTRLESDTDFVVGAGGGENFYTGVQGVIIALTTQDAIGAMGKLDKGA